ncbi:MAG TPA: DUF5667 domain-containing protein [Patescibacteria group bacterium]|jgi:hypothetical protein|nr:DUF5667 domain-containing protein [Patescibacteria group bacterium]
MKLFNLEQFENLIKLLKQSEQDFKFDQKSIKLNLLTSINSHHLPEKEKIKLREISIHRFSVYQYSAVFAVILFATGGATFALANTAKPGDFLFPLDLLQEKMVLSLPLSEQKKAKLESNFVSERIVELKQLRQARGSDTVKAAAVKESQKTLTSAVEAVTRSKDLLQARGRNQQAQELDNVLDELETLAGEHEKNAGEIKDEVEEPGLKIEIENNLTDIKKARLKAGHKIRGEKTRNDGNSQNQE